MTKPSFGIKTVAVLGAGTMGQGIALTTAAGGYKTHIYDIHEEALDSAISKIRESLRVSVEKGRMTEEQRNKIMERIVPAADLNDVKADLIIEAAIESLAVKQMLFRDAELVNGTNCIFASNTSSLPIDAIASGLKNPAHFLGVHFFNPAPVMKLVEIVAGTETDKSLIDTVREFLTSLGKTVVLSADTPGFIVNRVARHYYLEALKLAEDGACEIKGIDALLRSAGFRMGPFELMDLIGIDINYAVSKSVYEAFEKHPRFKPSRLQEQKVKEGKLGRKTGEGFYKSV